MNKLVYALVVLCVVGCGPRQLTTEQAMKIVASELNFPVDIIYSVRLADPREAERCLKLRLDSAGWVTVKGPEGLTYAGEPIITFTDKAEAFLLPASLNDVYTNVRRIKVGRKILKALSDIKVYGKEANGTAIVSYTDFNPLSVLGPEYTTKQEKLLLTFVPTNNGWFLLK